MKKILLILMLFSININFAQNKTIPQQNQQEIQKLKETVKKQTDTIAKYKTMVKDGNSTLIKAEKVYDTAKSVFNLKANTINWIVGLFFTFIGFIISFLGYNYIQAKKDLKKHIDDSKKQYADAIAKVANSQKQIVIDLLKKHNKEHHLLNTSKILILNKEESGLEHNLKMIYERYKDTIDKEDISDILKFNLDRIDFSMYDIVILENFNNKNKNDIWNFSDSNLKEKLLQIVLQSVKENAAFLFFGSRDYDGNFSNSKELKKYSHLINFANFPATLFSNLTNLLDLRRLIKDK